MAPSKTTTIVVLAVTAAVLVGWDVYVATNDEPGDTISELVYAWSTDHLLVPVAFGVLVGHFFWPQRRKQ